MGVHGLTTYLRENLRTLSTSLILSQEEAKSKPTLPLVVDGWSFIYEVHNQSRLPWVYGGELGEFRDLVVRVVRAWISVGLRPYFVFDGPYRPSKFMTSAIRMAQSIIQPSLLFFRTSPLSRATPRFLRENSILPPLYYATTLDALRSLNDTVDIFFADDEGDPFAVELAGRLKGYVTGRDSDFVILNSEGYAGYIPMDQMFWSIESHGNEGGNQSEDDAGFVVARKNKARGHVNEASNQGIIPPDTSGELSLSLAIYTSQGLASHLQISPPLLPLLAALIGNDFTADRHPVNKLFFDRKMTVSQRIGHVVSALRTASAVATGSPAKRKARRQISSVVDFVDLTIETLLIRPTSMGSGERESMVEKTVDAALQYAIPKHQECGEGSTSVCPLHDSDSCPLVACLSRLTSDRPPESETEARKQVCLLYLSAYRHGHFSPSLMDILSTGTAWPDSFLENPDVETVSRSLGRPIREWVYAIMDDGIGLMWHDVDLEENGLGTSTDEASDDDEIVDVVEEDSDEDVGPGNPLAPLQGALKELTIGGKPPPSTSSHSTISRGIRPKYVTEHIRRGTRHAEEPVSVPLLTTLLSSHDINTGNDRNARPIQLEDEDFRLTVFLRFLNSNTHLVKALPSEYLMAVVSLRWIVSRLANRADEAQSSTEREKEKWTTREAQAFLASFSWLGVTSVEPGSPPLENRSIQLTAQILAAFDAVEMLSQVLLLTNKSPNRASLFSGRAFHDFLAKENSPDMPLPPGLWDACVDGLEGAFAHEREKKKKRSRKPMEGQAKTVHGHGPAVHGNGTRIHRSMFGVLSAMGDGV